MSERHRTVDDTSAVVVLEIYSMLYAQDVHDQPTVLARSPYGTWQEFTQPFNVTALTKWANRQIGSSVVEVRTAADLQSLFRQCGGILGNSTSPYVAAWDLCMLLVSNSNLESEPNHLELVPALWRMLSVVFRGRVAFGFVHTAAAADEVLQQLGTLSDLGSEERRAVEMCNGNVRTAKTFKGAAFKGQSIRDRASSSVLELDQAETHVLLACCLWF